MSVKSGLFDRDIAQILTKLKEKNQRYLELKKHLEISDATLSKKIALLKTYDVIEPHSTKFKTGRNYIVYSLTPTGIKIETASSEYLKRAQEIEA